MPPDCKESSYLLAWCFYGQHRPQPGVWEWAFQALQRGCRRGRASEGGRGIRAAGRLERKIAFLIYAESYLKTPIIPNLGSQILPMYLKSLYNTGACPLNPPMTVVGSTVYNSSNISDILYSLCLTILRGPWRSLKYAISVSVSLAHGGLFLWIVYDY